MKFKTGFLAWFFHRITGIILVTYLFFHLFTLNSSLFIFSGKTLLFIFIIVHALNGVRLIIIDMGFPLKWQKHLFWGLMASGIIILLLILVQ